MFHQNSFIPGRGILLALLAAGVVAGACNKTSVETFEVTDEVLFRAGGPAFSADVVTKATSGTTAVTALTTFNVSATTGAADAEVAAWTSQAFTTDGEATPTYTGGKWWPLTDPGYHFYAANATLVHTASGATVTVANTTDVVCAYLASPTYKTKNTLTFDHVFARVGSVTVSAADSYTISGVTISITPKVSGTYNLLAGAGQTDGTGWSATSDGSVTAIATAVGANANDVYLVPGTYTLKATWTATKGDYSETFTDIEVDVALVAGKTNNITAALTGNATEIQFGVSLTAWADNAVDVGTFPLANLPKPIGEFTINASGDKVGFAPGNLRAHISAGPDANAIYTADEWGFHANQWDLCNQTLAVGNTVDLFGWVGSSATWDMYGLSTYTFLEDQYYGTSGSDALKTDWGSIPGVVSALGSGWFTLSRNEWVYVFDSRATGATVNGTANASYTEATIRTDVSGVNGIILFPDGYAGGTPAGVTWGSINVVSDYETTCTAAGFASLEATGCVFLPASGYRYGSGLNNVGGSGYYWSRTANGTQSARRLEFWAGGVDPLFSGHRYYGYAVRLVKAI